MLAFEPRLTYIKILLGKALKKPYNTYVYGYLTHMARQYLDIFNDCESTTAVISGGMIKGIITAEIVQQFVGSDTLNANYFICGSPRYTDTVCNLLRSLGVKDDRIYFEALGF